VMQMLVKKLFLLLNFIFPMAQAEDKIILHLHQNDNDDSATVDEYGLDYIVDEDNQAAAFNGSSPDGSSWTTRSSFETRSSWTTRSDGPCVDTNENCPEWSRRGECQNMPEFMLRVCRKSCRVCTGSEKCGEHNNRCEDCGKKDCMDSDKCKWIDARWNPRGPFGVCKPRGSDKCGEHNIPCEDCGKEECMDSDKCKWIDGNGNARWSPQGPQGVCKPREENGILSCNWTHDCQSYQACRTLAVSGCVCNFGRCVAGSNPFSRGSECDQYTDCDCRNNPETCFCKDGYCEETMWECHEKRDCARLSKCRDKDCTCSGNLCEQAPVFWRSK